eukprot:m.53218 g.53218  ORF g.53218 m.53218 type:complete len:1350 (-) comp18370_c0_seq1:118-4167(-)
MSTLECMKYLQRPAAPTDIDSAAWTDKKYVWAPDEKEGFVQASLKSQDGDKATCQRASDNSQIVCNASDIQKCNPPKFDKVENMAELGHLNEASVLHNLRDRYYSDIIYTYSGLFCVVINPYKRFPIYDETVVDLYKGKKIGEMPPHVYAIADQAYRDMLQDREDQSILCTGESGAGKTENTKKVIQYLANIAAGSTARKAIQEIGKAAANRRRRSSIGLVLAAQDALQKGELENQLLQANPILETFGNASTIKNDNSSRFGKFIKIHFDASGYIIGTNIDTYLLEKSRTVRQGEGERNFHAFYQLLRGAKGQLREDLLLGDDYRFITNGITSIPNVDDTAEYLQTNNAFAVMKFSDEERDSVWRMVSAVMQFGNIEVTKERRSDQAQIRDDSVTQKVAHLLGINSVDLTKSLLRPRIKSGRDSVAKQQTKEQVDFAIEALAKALYERLFLWIVNRINKTLDKYGRDGKSFIGILDIAGFEIFKINSFEQLCINYTNEKLQQLFNHRMFQLEQAEYEKEGIEWTFIDFGLDLQPCIDLIEGKPVGLFELLDEQCFFPRATDKTLVEKYAAQLKNNDKFEAAGFRDNGDFSVMHYAGKVVYDAAQWLTKNKDPLNDNVTGLLEQSSIGFVQNLWGGKFSQMVASAGGTRRGQFRTVGHIYKDQVAGLMRTLESTCPNFVRCIIPNHKKQPGKIDAHLVLDQLRCNGVLEGIRICRQGFPSRILFQEFKQRYQLLTPTAIPKGFVEGRKACELMIKDLELDESSYRIGHSKVFFRAGALARLEEQRDEKLSSIIVGLQAFCRGFLGRIRMGNSKHGTNAIKILQRNARAYIRLRNWPWWRLFIKIKPLLKVSRRDEELTALRTELNEATTKLASEEARRKELEEKVEALQKEIQTLSHNLELSEESYADAEAARAQAVKKRAELEEEIDSLETQIDKELDENAKLVASKQELMNKVKELEEILDAANKDEARINKLESQVADYKGKFEQQMTVTQDMEEEKKKLKKQIETLTTDRDELAERKAKSEKAKSKFQHELEDLKVVFEREKEAASTYQKQAKKHDSALAAEKTKLEEANRQLDNSQREVRELTTKVLNLRKDLDEIEEKSTSLERENRQLKSELNQIIESKSEEGQNIAQLQTENTRLQNELEDANLQIDEVQEELEAATQAKLRVEVNLHALEEKMAQMNDNREEEWEEKRRGLQRQIDELTDEAEDARRAKSRISTEKKKLDLEVLNLREQYDESERGRKREIANFKNLQKKYRMLAAESDESTGGASKEEVRRLSDRIDKFKKDLEAADEENGKLRKHNRSLKFDIDELQEAKAVLEMEVSSLKTRLRRAAELDNDDSSSYS